jgi:Transposase, Mutator family
VCTHIWDATTTTAGTATAVTRGARAGEPADQDAGPAAVGDGRAHASTKVLHRGAESRRSALAAWADRPRDPVPDRLRRPSPGQTPVARRARTAKALQPGSPTAAQTRAADPRFAHQGVRAPPQALAATSRGQPRRCVARTWTGDASEHEGNLYAKVPDRERERIKHAYWQALDEAISEQDGKRRLQALADQLNAEGFTAAARCLLEDLDALVVHLRYPLRHRRRWRSTNLLERSLGEVKRRTKVMGRFPGESSCLTLVWAVLDLPITHQTNGIHFTALDRQRLKRARYDGNDETTPKEVTAA